MEGASGQHGQNAYWSSAKATSADATQSWYDELKDPGYDFEKPGFTSGIGHFTQVVWVQSTHVGAAVSKCGKFCVANYLPAGNLNTPEAFRKNVLPPDSDLVSREPEPGPAAEGSVTASSWNDDIEGALAGCPFDQFKGKIEEGFADGATVTVERGSGSITVTIKKGGSTSSMSGTWG